MNHRKTVDIGELSRLYSQEGQPIEVLARYFGCSATTIRRRLQEAGVQIRLRGPKPVYRSTSTDPVWSANIAYVVGILATDGNLSRDGRHITITSKDKQLLETVCACLGLAIKITRAANGQGTLYHRLEWSDTRFYKWLSATGLSPAKSLSLGHVDVPDEYFLDFVRGCIDGDGSILVYTDRYHKHKGYVYTRLRVTLASASCAFLTWMQASIQRMIGIRGSLSAMNRDQRAALWVLKYAKQESLQLLNWIYPTPDVPCLARKRHKANRFLLNQASP